MGVLAVGGRVKWSRVRVLGRADGRVQRVRVQQVPSHDIFVCPELLTFEISRKGSRVGVGEDVMQSRQNVSGIGLKRLLRNCPVCATVNNKDTVGTQGRGRGWPGTTGVYRMQEELGPTVVSRPRVPLNATM